MSDAQIINQQSEPEPPAVTEQPAQNQTGFWHELVSDKRLLYSTIGVVAFVLLSIGLIYYFLFSRNPAPPPPDVSVTLQTPSRIVAGQQFDFKISYSNRSDYTLTDLQLLVVLPKDFTFRQSNPAPEDVNGAVYKLPDIGPAGTGTVLVGGVLNGEIGEKRDLTVQLKYKISGFNTEYVSQQSTSLEIGAPNLVLGILGPPDVIAGQEVLYNVTYRNVSDEVLRGIAINLILPPEFKVTEATPPFDADTTWHIGDIAPGRESSLRFKGNFGAAASLQKVIEVEAIDSQTQQALSRAFTVTEVGMSPVVLSQELVGDEDGVVLPGETLRYRLHIENRGTGTLTNIVLSTDLEGNAYDFSTLKMTGGVLTNRTITWTPGGLNELRLLRPGGRVTVEFSIDILEVPTQIGERSMVVVSAPKLTSFELKEALLGTEISAKVKTQVDLIQEVAYESGAFPMRVGQETRFRVTWRLRNTTNLVSGAKVMADLPLGPNSYVGGQGLGGTTLSFDSGSSAVTWNIGNLDPHTEKSAYFTIAYTPTVADAGKQPPILVNNVILEAMDTFIGQGVFDETPVGPARPQGRIEP